MVETLARRFRREFHDNALLLYTLAQAYAEEGDKARADSTAQEARQLSPGKEPEQLLLHYVTATELQRRGVFAWAEQEYRHVIAKGPADHPLMAYAYFGLSEMFHDQADDLQAATLLEELLKIEAKEKPAEHEIAGRMVSEVRSRMHYFWALHFQSKNDPQRQRQHLLEALSDAEEVDIDALIAGYQCPGLPPEKHQEALDLIKKMGAELQEEIADDPKNATTYNQFAWLIGNTEGDLDLALKYSKKSIELSPDNGGYYDTLAHVYFTKGDYANAVSTQTRAAELDPHSGLILRELKVFREKLSRQPAAARPASS
jgi:tetratricopeptide (TPR) repeat protein